MGDRLNEETELNAGVTPNTELRINLTLPGETLRHRAHCPVSRIYIQAEFRSRTESRTTHYTAKSSSSAGLISSFRLVCGSGLHEQTRTFCSLPAVHSACAGLYGARHRKAVSFHCRSTEHDFTSSQSSAWIFSRHGNDRVLMSVPPFRTGSDYPTEIQRVWRRPSF